MEGIIIAAVLLLAFFSAFFYGRKTGKETERVGTAEQAVKGKEVENAILQEQRDNDLHHADDALRLLDEKRKSGEWK